MFSDQLLVTEAERSSLRLRLAAAALAVSLVLLGGGAPAGLPIALFAYVVFAVAARFLVPRIPSPVISRGVTVAAIGLDLVATAGLVAVLPLERPAWILFLFPIGIGALRFGPIGAAGAAALAVVLVDLVIALRLSEASALQLWPLQLLVAAALVSAEIARQRERDAAERDGLRQRAAALAELSGTVASSHVLRAASDHVARVPGVVAVWAWVQRDDAVATEHERGEIGALQAPPAASELPPRGRSVPLETLPAGVSGRLIGLHDDPRVALAVVVDARAGDPERRDALVLDLAAASSRALAAVVERERTERAVGELRVTLENTRGLLRAKEEAVATAVHELRTPLTSVGGYAQIMSRHLDTIQRQVAQLARLLSDLQPMAAPASPVAATPTDLRELVRGAVARVRVLSDADVDLDLPATAVVRTVDAPRIGQVVDNLLGNAVKYSPGPATIEVSLREDEDGVIVSVTDHGRGIAPDDQPHLFERGYRSHGARDVRGEGLGLSVVREIVEAHGGRVGASSPGEGRGSTFWILLPHERKGAAAEAPAPAARGIGAAGAGTNGINGEADSEKKAAAASGMGEADAEKNGVRG